MWPLAVSTGHCINGVFNVKNKSGRNNEMTILPGWSYGGRFPLHLFFYFVHTEPDELI